MKNKKTHKKTQQKSADYAHNPHYCMIYPDAENQDDESVTTSNQS